MDIHAGFFFGGSMQISEIVPGVFHFRFDKRVEMNKSLGRIQEYAENPKLHTRFFSTSRMKKYYKSVLGNGRACHYKFVLGCNIPSVAFQGFAREFGYWTAREKEVMRVVSELPQPFYVIAAAAEDDKLGAAGALDHEIAHGLYATNSTYRLEVDRLLMSLPKVLLARLMDKIQHSVGYAEHVVWDETHAYIATDAPVTLFDRLSITDQTDRKVLVDTHYRLNEVLKRYKAA